MTGPTLSVTEVAARLDVSRRWLIEQLRAGKFPGHRIGRQWRLTEADYDGILAATARKPLPKPSSSATPTTRRRLER